MFYVKNIRGLKGDGPETGGQEPGGGVATGFSWLRIQKKRTREIAGEYGCSSPPLPEGVVLLSVLQRRPGRVQPLEPLAQVAGVEKLRGEVHPPFGPASPRDKRTLAPR